MRDERRGLPLLIMVSLVLFGVGEAYLRTRYDLGLSASDFLRVSWAASLATLGLLGVSEFAERLMALAGPRAGRALLVLLFAAPAIAAITFVAVEASVTFDQALPALVGSAAAILLVRKLDAFAWNSRGIAGPTVLLGCAVVFLMPAQYGHDRWVLNGLPILMLVLGMIPITVAIARWSRDAVKESMRRWWVLFSGVAAVAAIGTLPHIYPGIVFYLKLLAITFAAAALDAAAVSSERTKRGPMIVVFVVALLSGGWSLMQPVHDRFGALGFDSLAGLGAATLSMVKDADGDGFYASGVPIIDCDDNDSQRYPGSRHSPCFELDALSSRPNTPVKPRHILVVLSDGLRASDAFDPTVMPWAHSQTEGRVRFTRAYSPGNTTRLSVKPMFTGVAPPVLVLDADEPLAADAWWFNSVAPPVVSHWIVASEFQWMHRADQWTRRKERETYIGKTDKTGRNISSTVDAVLQKFDEMAGGERAAFAVFSTDPHREYRCDDGAVDEVRCYHDELRALDGALKRLFAELERRGVAQDTMVILSSDHGEELGEHGHFGQHASTLFEEQIHVPLVVWYPPLQTHDVATPVSLLDLYATLEESTGGQPSRGRSLSPYLKGSASERPVLSHHWTGLVLGTGVRRTALILGDEKLEYDWRTGHVRYVELSLDPNELENRASERMDRVEQLIPLLHERQTYQALESRTAF